MRRGCLVCVNCNSNIFHSLIFKLCIMIVHTLKMCTSYFVQISCFLGFFFSFFFGGGGRGGGVGLELRHFFRKDCSCIEHVHLLICAHLIYIF